jgi:RNA polymerase sigma factor (sigma-70 family)
MEIAQRVARRIASRWKLVDTDDLTGQLYLWLVEHEAHVKRYRAEPQGAGKLYVALKREAARYAAKETAVRVNRPLQTDNFYTVELLDRALPYIFEETPQTVVMVNPRTGEPLESGESNLALTIITDIRTHYYGLAPQQKEIIQWRYRDGLTYEEIGELRNLSANGAMGQLQRAVTRLSEALAGDPL